MLHHIISCDILTTKHVNKNVTCEALIESIAGRDTNLGFVGFTCFESRHSEDNIATLKYSLLQSKCLPMFDEENKKVAEGLTLFSKYFRNLRD